MRKLCLSPNEQTLSSLAYVASASTKIPGTIGAFILWFSLFRPFPLCGFASKRIQEVSHSGSLYYTGNLVDWWEPATKSSYLEKAKCIIQQYGNYSIEHLNLTLNGINTQGENIADNGGIKEAYRAYSKLD